MTQLRHTRHVCVVTPRYKGVAMFNAFELQTEDTNALRRRMGVALVAAALTLGAMGVGVMAIANRPVTAVKEKQVDVSFRPPPPPPEPVKVEPPPPPPPPKPKAPTPVVVAEVVPPPAPAAMVAPKEIPKEKPRESDVAVKAIEVAVGGTGTGKMDVAPVAEAPREADESAAPVIASAGTRGPVNLPEDADPPVPNEDNAQPEYPESARTTGQEAKVVLKIVVESDGRVGRIQVLKGEEPFVSAALAVVRTWTYEPATLDGTPITVFKIVNITFSLRE